jgi:hypothetical protein
MKIEDPKVKKCSNPVLPSMIATYQTRGSLVVFILLPSHMRASIGSLDFLFPTVLHQVRPQCIFIQTCYTTYLCVSLTSYGANTIWCCRTKGVLKSWRTQRSFPKLDECRNSRERERASTHTRPSVDRFLHNISILSPWNNSDSRSGPTKESRQRNICTLYAIKK